MRSTFAKVAVQFGILAIAACSRTPLDPAGGGGWSDGDTGGAVGGGTGGSVTVASGGRANTGGSFPMGGNATAATAGGRPATGATGGRPNVGGSGGGGLGGGSGGFAIASGGRGGSAGSMPNGGIPARGGSGGFGASAGGTPIMAGGGAGGIMIRLDGGFGGGGGGGGGMIRDGGFDVRDVGSDRVDALLTGGNFGKGGAMSSGGSPCPGLASNEELIDDLNDGDRFIARVNGRLGAWKDGDDGTPGGTMYPDPAATFTPTDTGDACWKYAAYIKGTGFTDGGANLSFGLGAPYDASRYTGLSFWAKSDIPAGQTIHVLFPDKDTDPDGGVCKTVGLLPERCYDHYGATVPITPGWNHYTVAFKDLLQGGWGRQATAFDPSTLFEVSFQIPSNATFALWFDDVAFTM